MMLLPAAPARRRAVPSSLSPATVGRLLIILAFTVSGGGSVLAKMAYGMGATPVAFLTIRLATALAVLVVLTGPQMWRLGARRTLGLTGLGMAFGAQTLAYFAAVEAAPVGLVVVVVSTYPIIVVLLDAWAARRMPTSGRMALMTISLAALWVAAGSPTGRPGTGIMLALVSAVGYAVYLRASAAALTTVAPMVATAWLMAGALAMMIVVALATSPPVPGVGASVAAMAHGVVATVVPIVALYAALRRLPTESVAMLGPLEPLVATGIAAMALGERLDAQQLFGIVVVVLTVAALSGVRPRAGLPRLPIALPSSVRRQRVPVASRQGD